MSFLMLQEVLQYFTCKILNSFKISTHTCIFFSQNLILVLTRMDMGLEAQARSLMPKTFMSMAVLMAKMM